MRNSDAFLFSQNFFFFCEIAKVRLHRRIIGSRQLGISQLRVHHPSDTCPHVRIWDLILLAMELHLSPLVKIVPIIEPRTPP